MLANIFTALVVVSLYFTSAMKPTNGSFALFASILYIGFPLTIASNLSTGPMLDRVTPLKHKTFVQGLNSAIYDAAYGKLCAYFVLGNITTYVTNPRMFFYQ